MDLTNPTSASARCCRSTCSGAAQESSQGEGTWSQVQPLLDLEYYHPIQFCAIDAMHNLFLGTAKTFMRLLLQHKDKRTREDLLNDDKMAIIDQRLSEFKQGLTDEWVVENMKSNMGTFTATAGILCVLSSWTYPCAIPASLGALCEGVQTPVSSMHT